jgi:hypothetical protein
VTAATTVLATHVGTSGSESRIAMWAVSIGTDKNRAEG